MSHSKKSVRFLIFLAVFHFIIFFFTRHAAADFPATVQEASIRSHEEPAPAAAPQETPAPPLAPTPLEEIEEEENLPEDFFDFEGVDLPATLPPLAMNESDDPLGPEITYDVPIVFNTLVENYIVFFQTRLRDRFEQWLARSSRYLTTMQQIFQQQGLPEDLVFLALIESGFNPKAYSRAKAAGPWQFMKATGKKYGLRVDQWIDERRDPIKSTVAAAKYLKDLYEMFGSWPLSMASYNAGEGRIMRAMARTKAEDFWGLRTSNLRPETKNYVPKFMAATIIAKNPRKYGFFIEYESPFLYEEVHIPKPTSLKAIAKAAGITIRDLKLFNPEIKKEMTPPNYPRYHVKLPVGTKEVFLKNFGAMPEKELNVANAEAGADHPGKHRIKRGETISSIARKYDVKVRELLKANQLSPTSTILAGQLIVIPAGE